MDEARAEYFLADFFFIIEITLFKALRAENFNCKFCDENNDAKISGDKEISFQAYT